MNSALLRSQIAAFLAEDIGRGDLTSESIFTDAELGAATLVARQDMIVAGVSLVAGEVFRQQNPAITITNCRADGNQARAGEVLMSVQGPVLDLLQAERVALNLLQRLCGIATQTRRYVNAVAGSKARITDTRKTTPGLRMLEKYAVTVGGGHNHRFNLTDGVLIKDNHIAACGSINTAVERVRATIPHTIRIEVECDTLAQVEECLACQVDIIMLDNMALDLIRQSVNLIAGRALVEASGGVNLDTVSAIAACGVDIISVGSLTHSTPSCDIGMDWTRPSVT